jgi:hypothetical protein
MLNNYLIAYLRKLGLSKRWLICLLVSVVALGQLGAQSAYPVKKSANGRYLVDQNNIPFLMVGDSPHSMVTNLTLAQASSYLSDRAAHGFNSLWVEALCYPYVGGNAFATTYDGIAPFTRNLSNGEYDLTSPNEAYFERVDSMISLAGQQGLVVALDPCDTGGWTQTMLDNGASSCRSFGQFLGNRYKNVPNIIWVSGNDFQTWTTSANDAVVLAVAQGIQSVDSNHIHTVELEYYVSSSLDDPKWASVVGLNLAYTYYPTYAEVLHGYSQSSSTPVFMGEAYYEFSAGQAGVGEDGTPGILRRQEYWTMTSGATGQFYGNNYTWQFSSGWQQNLDSTGVTQLNYMTSLFQPLAWYELVPDTAHSVVTAGYGTFSNNTGKIGTDTYLTAASTPDGSLAVAYLPNVRTVTVNLAKFAAPVTAQWFDPTNGTYAAISGSPFSNSGSTNFTPAAHNSGGDVDWVLLLSTGTVKSNNPPVITSATTATATAGNSFTYTIAATNSPTSYNAVGLPAGLSVNTNTGVISGTPAAAGTWGMTISATNAGGTGSAVLMLTVNPPAPAITSATSASGTVGTAFSYSITASNSPTSYSVNGTLPSGLTFNSGSGVISGTPTAAVTSNVTVNATNAGGTGSAALSIIIVQQVQQGAKPTITSATSASGTVNAAFSYSITASNSPTSYSVTGALPAGLALNTGSGVISGTPTSAVTSNVTIGATNANGTGTAVLTLTINPASASNPTFVQDNYSDPSNRVSSASATYSAAQSAGDLNVVIIGWSSTSVTVSSVTDTKGNVYHLAAGPTVMSGFGTQSIYYASNIAAATAGANAVMVRFASTVSFPDLRIVEYRGASAVDGSAASTGSSNAPSSGSVATRNATDLLVAGNYVADMTTGPGSGFTSRVITSPDGDIIEDRVVTTTGSYSGGTATRSSGAWIAQMVAFESSSIGAPVITSATSASGTVGAAFSYSITASNSPTSYSVTGTLPAGLTLNAGTGAISGTPTAAVTSNVTISATNAGGTGSAALVLTINSPAPVITSATSASGTVGVPFSYSITASNSPTSYSVDGTLFAGLTLNTSTGVISGTPTAAVTSNVTINATNAAGTGSAVLALTINPPAPAITSATSASGTVGAAFSYSITASNSPTSYSVAGSLPAGLALNTSSGVISGTPTAAVTSNVTVNATNAGGTGSAALSITIAQQVQQGAKPAITSATSASGTVGAAFSYAITASNSPTSYSVTGALPSGLALNTGNGVISGTPTSSVTLNVTIGATNANGTGTAVLTLTINPASASNPTFVQDNFSNPQNGVSSASATYSAAQSAGDLNVVIIGWSSTSVTVSSVTDSKGNVYRLAAGPTVMSGFGTQSIYYAANVASATAGSNAVTVRFSSSAAFPDLRIVEYRGVSAVDGSAGSTGSSNAPSSGSVATTNATDLLVAGNYIADLTTAPGSGFTSRVITSPDGDIIEDRVVTTTGSYSGGTTTRSSGAWIAQVVAFR